MVSESPPETVPGRHTASLRIYCSAHNLGFTAPRAARIKCESGGHELDQGFPHAEMWEYCCDCQHYWLLDANKALAEHECPVCERKTARRFLCGECKVIAIESDSPGRRKAYSISSQGTASPACPGCLNRTPPAGLEHECVDFGGSFVTPLSVCPFCDEALESPPSFPCSVSSYIERLRMPPVTLQFDPASNLLLESKSGDYVLLEKVRGLALPLVIPKAARLNSKQDYYNTYYELFNCDNPAQGDVIILSPAIVEKSESGWQLREAGFIEIKPDPSSAARASLAQTMIACPACGAIRDQDHAFCKRCGLALSQTSSQRAETIPRVPQTPPLNPAASADPRGVPFSHSTDNVPSTEAFAPATGGSSTIPWKTLLGVVAAVALLGVVVSIASFSGVGRSVEKKLDAAIATKNLFGPSSDNAYDLYYQLKNSGASEQTLAVYRERLLPLLTSGPLQMINVLMVPGSDDPPLADWQAANQPLTWAAELKPDDSVLRSRAVYCEGRVAYLLNREDEAISAWTRASDTDKNWPLPVNGIGLIHSNRKNWGTARTYYFEAVRRDPNWAYPYNNLGTAFHYDRNDRAAKEYYQKAVQLAPRWARPHAWLGDIALKERDFVTAVTEYEAVLDPSSTGTKNMDLDKIRAKLEKARLQMSSSEE